MGKKKASIKRKLRSVKYEAKRTKRTKRTKRIKRLRRSFIKKTKKRTKRTKRQKKMIGGSAVGVGYRDLPPRPPEQPPPRRVSPSKNPETSREARSKYWANLSEDEKRMAEGLGWSQETWDYAGVEDEGIYSALSFPWGELSEGQKNAARGLGFMEEDFEDATVWQERENRGQNSDDFEIRLRRAGLVKLLPKEGFGAGDGGTIAVYPHHFK